MSDRLARTAKEKVPGLTAPKGATDEQDDKTAKASDNEKPRPAADPGEKDKRS